MDKELNLIRSAIEEGDTLFLKILKDHPILNDDDPRQSAMLLNLMTNCISRLHILGWSEKDLCNEVFDWCEQARTWYDEQEDDDE